ncbi:AtpZ/AtpI family protein [Sorangium atrum]|uniref:AtpZ/AtpI family protein n=1 Tax=Sorangium atrum TaxID=2995308 RepID=A0ABT5CDT9_9BACT|nr:AtpZ/AtpI family protein [Sorangium aterium]MDC0683954.1 AtpZ/AtpI family protein [Sorangium aterium]
MKQDWKAVGSYGTVGLEVVLCMLVGLFIGRWLDGKLGTDPYLSVLWFFFGIGAAGKAVFRAWKDMQAVAEREEREQGNPAPRFDDRKTRQDERAPDDDRRTGSSDDVRDPDRLQDAKGNDER